MERFMSRLMVYSHDTYGLGNLRRMLSICEYLSSSIADLSILLISGSPMAHSFRLPRRLDYIKLPCLTRIEREGYSVRSLGLSLTETIRLRSDVILSAASNFKPDLLLVDKKPAGIKNELEATLAYLKSELPETRHVLILRDILDAPEATISVWERQGYHDVIQSFYDLVLVLGMAEIFDPRLEYRFPEEAAARVRFCGYLKPQSPKKTRDEIRKEFDLADQERLVLVTPGGGEDGYRLLAAYLEGLALIPPNYKIHSHIVSGPEMAGEERKGNERNVVCSWSAIRTHKHAPCCSHQGVSRFRRLAVVWANKFPHLRPNPLSPSATHSSLSERNMQSCSGCASTLVCLCKWSPETKAVMGRRS